MSRFIAFAGIVAFCLPASSDEKKKPPPKVEPRIMLAVPIGAAPGKTTKLTLRGVGLESAKDVKLLDGGGSIKVLKASKAAVPDKNLDKVGDTQIEIELKLDAKLTSTSVALVVVTPNGETKPHTVLIGAATAEVEPNDGFREAQAVPLPAVIQGTIGRPRDVDVFRLEGKKGQKLYAEVLASRHGSPLDAILTLYDARGMQIASNDDFAKDHHDARIEFVLPADGTYYLSLIDAHDSGSNLHVYRLVVK